MKLKHIKNGEETVIMQAPHEDALKAKAREIEGYPASAVWKRGVSGESREDVAAAQTQAEELDLEDGSLLRISID